MLAHTILAACAAVQICIGVFLLSLLVASIYDPDGTLKALFLLNSEDIGILGGNSWAQTAVAFGMHGYADVFNGYEQLTLMLRSPHSSIPKVLTNWNSTRFFVSFLWLLTLLKGLVQRHPTLSPLAYPLITQVLLVVLAIDAVLLRPIAVYCQRVIDDYNPREALEEMSEWSAFTPIQRVCRSVFYYEAVLSGTSGLAYCIVPDLFPWLFGFPAQAFTPGTLWSLSQFGACVSAFGLYQMNADIDTRSGMIAWWLWLDVVWLYVYWWGVKLVYASFNPFTLSGGNLFTHLAFHADSTLALARTVFLVTLAVRGRGGTGGWFTGVGGGELTSSTAAAPGGKGGKKGAASASKRGASKGPKGM